MPRTAASRLLLPVLLATAIVAILWPSLWWVDFSTESEQLVVGAALESLRDGSPQQLWQPTLNGEVRLRKPPLTTWVAMGATSSEEARRLAAGPLDASAYQRLAVKVRTTSLLAGLAMLVLTFELGRLLGGRTLGLAAMAMLGGMYGFIEHTIRVTTDLHLALWALAANVALAHAVLRRRYLSGFALAGAALGLAMMSKGPVCLVQTAAPVLAFVALRRFALRRHQVTQNEIRPRRAHASARVSTRSDDRRRFWTGAAAGTLLLLLIGLPWFIDALLRNPSARAQWTTEISRVSATSVGADEPWDYAIFFGLLLPWTPFFLVALVTATNEALRRLVPRLPGLPGLERARGPGILLALALVVVPIAIMIWFPDRKERYLLPILPPAAVLAAFGLLGVLRNARRRPAGARALFAVHWIIVAAIAVGIPVLMMTLPRNAIDGDTRPWLSPVLALPLAIGGAALVVASMLGHRRRGRAGLLSGTTASVLFGANVFLAGYGRSLDGMSELEPLAAAVRARFDEFRPVYDDERAPPPDLLIYLGRVIRHERDPAALPREGAPVVWFARRHRDDPPLEPAPGWRLIGRVRRDSNFWSALARE